MSARISFDDLEHALYWVSSPPEFEAEAFISRTTGAVHFRGTDGPVNEDFPEDIEDGTEYVAVPHKSDLGLGRDLALRFVSEKAGHLEQQAREAFRQKGAYSRFKAMLTRNGLIESWHEYERQATVSALERWAGENSIEVNYAHRGA